MAASAASKESPVKDTLKKLGVSVGSIVFLVLLLEIGFRIFYVDNTLTLDLDPELYWFPRPSQKTAEVTINSVGLRGPETKEKDPTRFRILTTGDSFTFGDRVTDPESWPAQLGALLDKDKAIHPGDKRPIEILNGGGPGWGIFQMERYLRRAIPRYQPDLVMLTITPIDIYRQPFTSEQLAAYIKSQERRKALRDASVFLTFIARRVVRLQQGHRAVPNEMGEDADKDALWGKDSARIKALIEEFSGKTKFMLLVLQDFSKEHDWVAEHVGAFAGSMSTPFFDLGPTYTGMTKDGLTVVGDGHPNGKGHGITAKAIEEMLFAKGWAEKP
ncbi:MAG: SGNH/GDSL hydrolase family protein [Byssovorax sp.]